MIESVLLPLVVAAVTTLLIEYAAKPRLEVRKDRILEQHRAEREVRRTLDHAEYLRGRLEAIRDAGSAYPLEDVPAQVATEYAATTEKLRDLAAHVNLRPKTVDDLLTTACARSWAFGVLVMRASAEEARKPNADLDEVIGLLVELLETPRFRVLKRRALIRQAVRFSPTDEGV